MKIKELYSDETRWTQKAFARNKERLIVGSLSEEAVCWCLDGAIEKCYGTGFCELNLILRKRLGTPVIDWNDDPKRSFQEVKNIVEELDI